MSSPLLKKHIVLFCLCCLVVMQTLAQTKNVKVLVYTKNGNGYVHDNRAASVKCIQALGAANGFKVDTSNNAAVFTEQNLKQYTLLIFSNTNNDVFDTNAQRLAFRRYIENGGGFVGLHSVMGTERNWTWFKQLIGGTFAWHAVHQKFTVKVIDPSHPTVKGWPLISERPLGDECYFTKEFYSGIKVTMAHDITTLLSVDSVKIKNNKGSFGNLFPAEWYQSFDGGNVWITTLGHDKEYYQQADFSNHLLAGIQFVLAKTKSNAQKKAYALQWDEEVR